jgi:hypothetical protein
MTKRLEPTLSNFEVIDRRRSKPQDEEAIVPAEPVVSIDAPAATRQWKDVAYVLAFMPIQNGNMLIIGRAVGIRKDGLGPFLADFLLPNIWGPDFTWQKEAKKRLDTFLGCECSTQARCPIHTLKVDQWATEDRRRLETVASAPMPEAVELLVRAEMAAQAKKSNLVVPR